MAPVRGKTSRTKPCPPSSPDSDGGLERLQLTPYGRGSAALPIDPVNMAINTKTNRFTVMPNVEAQRAETPSAGAKCWAELSP